MICLESIVEQISIGQIAVCVTFVLGFIGSIGKLKKILSDWTTKQVTPLLNGVKDSFKKDLDDVKTSFNDDLASLRKEVNELKAQADRQDMENVKNYLVLFLADIDRGIKPNEIELARFNEEMKYYEKKGGNSYVHVTYDRLRTEGKLMPVSNLSLEDGGNGR